MTLYDILEVSPYASNEVIDKAYKVLAKKYHPDLQPDNLKKEYEEKLKKIIEAYEILRDDSKRSDYDSTIGFKRENNYEKHYAEKDNVKTDDTKKDNNADDFLSPLDNSNQNEIKYKIYAVVIIVIIGAFIWSLAGKPGINNKQTTYSNYQPTPVVVDKYTKAIQEADGLKNNQQLKEAMSKYTEAITLDEKRAEGYVGRAGVYNELGLYQNAINDTTTGIKYNPENYYLYFVRAYGYVQLKQYEKSITDYKKAISLNPKDAWGYHNLSVAYMASSDFNNALININKAIEIEPNEVLRFKVRARIYEFQKNYGSAEADYNRILKIEPKDTDANEGLTRIALQRIKGN